MTNTMMKQFTKVNTKDFEEIMIGLNDKMVSVDIGDSNFICEEFQLGSDDVYYILANTDETISYSIKRSNIKIILIDEYCEDDTAIQIVVIMNDDTEVIMYCEW